MPHALAVFFLLLGVWGAYSARPLASARRPWSWRAWLLAVTLVLLVGSSWTVAGALATGRFAGWMLVPVGLTYLLMLPLPCYFEWVTATRQRHVVRNVVFVVVAALCFAVACGFLEVPGLLGQ